MFDDNVGSSVNLDKPVSDYDKVKIKEFENSTHDMNNAYYEDLSWLLIFSRVEKGEASQDNKVLFVRATNPQCELRCQTVKADKIDSRKVSSLASSTAKKYINWQEAYREI